MALYVAPKAKTHCERKIRRKMGFSGYWLCVCYQVSHCEVVTEPQNTLSIDQSQAGGSLFSSLGNLESRYRHPFCASFLFPPDLTALSDNWCQRNCSPHLQTVFCQPLRKGGFLHRQYSPPFPLWPLPVPFADIVKMSTLHKSPAS